MMRRRATMAFMALICACLLFGLWRDGRFVIGAQEARMNPHNAVPGSTSSPSTSAPVIRRKNGKYRGSNGQHTFYHAKERDWSVPPHLVKTLCKETNLTQCNPTPRRADSVRAAEKKAHPPFNMAAYVRFPHEPNDPTFDVCDYDNCVYTGKDVTPQTDAVFVYGVGLDDSVKVPDVRLPNQTYILGSWEAPENRFSSVLNHDNSSWSQVFNAIMTYRYDADIVYGYGKLDFQPRLNQVLPDYLSLAKKKKRTAVWFVSNCNSERMEYVKEMKKYIDIDIFGRCGEACEVADERCIEDFADTYSFYLAFENIFSRDYITEKFFKLFVDGYHIIPVTRGAVDYTREFPEKSLVNAADFEGPKQLALFLKRLASDPEEYSRYLEVKDMYRAITYGNRWCLVCELLHKKRERDAPPGPARNIRKFFGM